MIFINISGNLLAMEVGFNSDITYSGHQYHVQTEDWGFDNPFIVTKVFSDGAIVASYKTPYYVVFKKARLYDKSKIQSALKYQHQTILDRLISGQLLPKSLK